MLLNLLNSAAGKRAHIVLSPSVVSNLGTLPRISIGRPYLFTFVTNY